MNARGKKASSTIFPSQLGQGDLAAGGGRQREVRRRRSGSGELSHAAAAYFRAASYRFATSLQFTTFHQAET